VLRVIWIIHDHPKLAAESLNDPRTTENQHGLPRVGPFVFGQFFQYAPGPLHQFRRPPVLGL
jgi:hypothetical protein